TNDEAMQIAGLLIQGGLQAKLIHSNDGFSLYNLIEIRYFLDCLKQNDESYAMVPDEWNIAKRRLIDEYRNSTNLDICLNLINDFEATNPRTKYKTDLDIFIRESKLEDFSIGKAETIYVSTMHKAKGRQYDNVYIMLDDFNIITEENMRLLYVAMTRAKNNLIIHSNKNYFSFIKTEGIERINDYETYLQPERLAIQLGYKDVWLDYFLNCQRQISGLNCGDILTINDDSCYDQKGQEVLRFSKQFTEQIVEMEKKGYIPKEAMIRFIVYWQRENTDYEIKIILPQVYFEKVNKPI
ncbi:MAG: ATP-binding domain-containing protein, partial [Clostridiales bacterium]|nr:ATP-binding domain-containing protein [Clostridiales bacterium]